MADASKMVLIKYSEDAPASGTLNGRVILQGEARMEPRRAYEQKVRNGLGEYYDIVGEDSDSPSDDLSDVKWVGDASAKALREAGLDSFAAIAGADVATLAEVAGTNEERAEAMKASATELTSEE